MLPLYERSHTQRKEVKLDNKRKPTNEVETAVYLVSFGIYLSIVKLCSAQNLKSLTHLHIHSFITTSIHLIDPRFSLFNPLSSQSLTANIPLVECIS